MIIIMQKPFLISKYNTCIHVYVHASYIFESKNDKWTYFFRHNTDTTV